MKVKPLLLASCSASVLLSLNAASQSGEDSIIDEIIVTAEKRSASLQDVALAISAFTAETRDLIGINTITDLTDFTPGLTYSLTEDRMSLRGVGRLTNSYGSDPGIANYVDGFYTASTVEAGKPPIVVDRIEVLRGPQGTLYGRNSIGGAINIISKRPSDSFQGEVRTTIGNYDTAFFDGALSGPVTEWLRYRVAGRYGGNEDGYFRDVDGDNTEGSLRNQDLYLEGQLEVDLGDNLAAWFKYATAEWDQSRRTLAQITPRAFAPLYFNGVLDPTGTFQLASLSPNALYNGGDPRQPLLSAPYLDEVPSLSDRRAFDTDTAMDVSLKDVDILTLELIWRLAAVDVKYLGGYQGYTYSQVADIDGVDRASFTTLGFNPLTTAVAPLTISTQFESFYQEDKEYYSNELNFISTHEGPLQWIFGLYQYHEQVYQFAGYRAPFQAELQTPLLLPSLSPGPANPNREYTRFGTFLDADARAVFGQIDWSLSDAWKLTVGARYTEDEKDADEFRTRVIFGAPAATLGITDPAPTVQIPALAFAFYAPGELNRTNKLAGEWDAVTGTVGMEWTPSVDTLVFAKYTRGYKSGGFNAGELLPASLAYTDAEHINSYEVGWKNTFRDRLTANIAVFYYDYSDLQVPLAELDPATGLTRTPFFNVDAAESMGVELETVWAVSDSFQILLTYSWLDSEIKDDSLCVEDSADKLALATGAQPCAQGFGRVFQSVDGARLPATPEHKVAFNANYTWRMSAGSLTLSGSWTYKDETTYSVFERDHYTAPSYDETDFRALWNDAGGRYTFIAFVKNAFDDEGYERAAASESFWYAQSRELALTDPRTYGLEVQFRFGD